MPQSSEIIVSHRHETPRVAAYQLSASYLEAAPDGPYSRSLCALLTADVMAILVAAFAVNWAWLAAS
jgi:hypothetical protein